MSLNILAILNDKIEKRTLSEKQIAAFIQSVCSNNVDQAQIGAFLAAVCINGMTPLETAHLTREMVRSGDFVGSQWSDAFQSILVDKHSTGGVGDKVSLALTPAVAACGGKVPMISGRGLGHTGGTIDKLESLKGYQSELSISSMKNLLDKVGCFIVGQSENVAPGDRILYEARNRTSTVMSLPLITASILSKKAVEGISSLIMDVKFGNGAFMKDYKDAKLLAESIVSVATEFGIKTTALITEMNSPLGNCVGNALEIAETLLILNGLGPDDVVELITLQGGHMLASISLAKSVEEGSHKIKEVLQNGSALEKFGVMLQEQGVCAELVQRLTSKIHTVEKYLEIMDQKASNVTRIVAKKDGWINQQDSLKVAKFCSSLGANKFSQHDKIDYAVGVNLLKKVGDQVVKDEPWIDIFHNKPLTSEDILSIDECIVISCEQVSKQSRIHEIITPETIK